MPLAASADNSRNGAPGSIRRSTRSRGNSLPRPVWRSRARAGPPCAASARFSSRSLTSARIAAALARNSFDCVSTTEASFATGPSPFVDPAYWHDLKCAWNSADGDALEPGRKGRGNPLGEEPMKRTLLMSVAAFAFAAGTTVALSQSSGGGGGAGGNTPSASPSTSSGGQDTTPGTKQKG